MRLTLSAILCVLTSVAWAQGPEREIRGEITPFAGYRIGGEFEDTDTGEALDLDEAASYGLLFDWNLDSRRQIEVLYSHQETELDLEGSVAGVERFDVDVDYLQIGGVYIIDDSTRVQPYVAATVGITHLDPQDSGLDSETKFSGSIGVGGKIQFSERIGLRFEGRGYMTLFDSSGEVFCSGGCQIKVESSAFTQLEFFTGITISF